MHGIFKLFLFNICRESTSSSLSSSSDSDGLTTNDEGKEGNV